MQVVCGRALYKNRDRSQCWVFPGHSRCWARSYADRLRLHAHCTQQGVGACFTPISVCEFYITAYFTGPKKQRREIDATAICLNTSPKRPNNLDSLLIVTSEHRWLPNTDDFPTQMTSQHRNPVRPSLSLSFFLSHSFSCFVDKGPTQHLVRVTGSEFVRQHLARQRWWLPCLDVDSRVLECRGPKYSRVTQRSW